MIYTSVLLKQFLGSKDIEAINGKVRIKLEEGIQSGKILRLKQKDTKYQWLRKRRFIGSCKCLDAKTLKQEQNSFSKKKSYG
jgi:molecular chaperone DnaJ